VQEITQVCTSCWSRFGWEARVSSLFIKLGKLYSIQYRRREGFLLVSETLNPKSRPMTTLGIIVIVLSVFVLLADPVLERLTADSKIPIDLIKNNRIGLPL